MKMSIGSLSGGIVMGTLQLLLPPGLSPVYLLQLPALLFGNLPLVRKLTARVGAG